MQPITFLLIHGNGGNTVNDNWFPYVKNEIALIGGKVIAETFPDNILARESVWIPFMEKKLKGNPLSVIIGHSSGAIAAMRYAESHKILGSVLVGCYHTDLGIETEKESGYFNRPWNWEAIRNNQKWIIQFSATNDPWIPIEEPRFVNKQLQSHYYEYDDMGHFGGDYIKPTFPELIEALKKELS